MRLVAQCCDTRQGHESPDYPWTFFTLPLVFCVLRVWQRLSVHNNHAQLRHYHRLFD